MQQNKPPVKRLKTSEDSGNSSNLFVKIIQQLSEMQQNFNERLLFLENKLDFLIDNIKDGHKKEKDVEHKCCNEVLTKFTALEQILKTITQLSLSPRNENNPSADDMVVAPIVLLPTSKPTLQLDTQLDLDANIQVITLNNECDYPGGCWLGDEKNVEARVRVPITQEQLLHINAICTTPEKMATVLLDYLFPQDVQAVSNLSGKGKHCKKQLDPLKIYAIRSHLMHIFNITERHWYRIKQNLDSKCRTAWRKKAKGIPLSSNKNITPPSSNSKLGVLGSDSLILSGPFVSEESLEEDGSELFSVEDSEYLALTGTGEQTLTIVTDSGEVVVPDLNTDDSLSNDQSSSSFLA